MSAATTAGNATAGIREWFDPRDPVALIGRGTLFLVIINSTTAPVLFVGVAVLTAIVFRSRRLVTHPALFIGLAAVVGFVRLQDWELVDNHVFATAYWTLAVGLALASRRPEAVLAASGRLIAGLIFAFAVFWKLFSGEYVDADFFRYSLLFDDRFETVARVVGGTSSDALAADIDRFVEVRNDLPAGEAVGLTEGPRNEMLARVMTWWGLAIEAFAAVVLLAPLRRRWSWLRHAAIGGFALTTYLIVPVGGFGCLLMLLGISQTDSLAARRAYMIGFGALLLWSPVWLALIG